MIIFLIGPDCSGKDTVRHELNNLLNHAPWIIARSPVCNIVYDIIYKRKSKARTEYFKNVISKMTAFLDAKFVLLTTQPEELLRRTKSRPDPHLKTLDDASLQMKTYNSVVDDLCKCWRETFYKVSTDQKTPKQVAKEIANVLKIDSRTAIKVC